MTRSEITVTVGFPAHLYQCVVAMAAQDLREPSGFLVWLAHCEAAKRGLLEGPQAGDHTRRLPEVTGEESNAEYQPR